MGWLCMADVVRSGEGGEMKRFLIALSVAAATRPWVHYAWWHAWLDVICITTGLLILTEDK